MRSLTIAAALALAACSQGVPTPDYDPPYDSAALEAYKAAMKSDWVDKPYDLSDQPPAPNAMNYRKSVEWNEKLLANRHAPKAYGALQKLKLGACEWARFSRKNVLENARERIPAPPPAAYHCSMTLHYQINPPYGDKETVEASGYFFKSPEQRFVYAGKFAHPY